ncbi:MAG: hypothetical protein Ct9H300mP8_00430 [Gammaproteobacteria bacterium]|nr:MAG: hypothetical protein Ct9H300mP8_00430 [Gammaproteobacteria bacterium]
MEATYSFARDRAARSSSHENATVTFLLAGRVAQIQSQSEVARLALHLMALGLFTVLGPWVWTIDPTAQDLDQISTPPVRIVRRVVEPYLAGYRPTLRWKHCPLPTRRYWRTNHASRSPRLASRCRRERLPRLSGYSEPNSPTP